MLFKVAIRVSGRVQGVGFRYFTLETAESIGGLTGYVRNEDSDRSVEIRAEGERADLERFISIVRDGPSLSRVADFVLDWSQIEKRDYETFSITH